MGEQKNKDLSNTPSTNEEVTPEVQKEEPTVEVGKSYLNRNDILKMANVEYVSKKGSIVTNLEVSGVEMSNEPSVTFDNPREFFKRYYPSEEGKTQFKEFMSKMYSKL